MTSIMSPILAKDLRLVRIASGPQTTASDRSKATASLVACHPLQYSHTSFTSKPGEGDITGKYQLPSLKSFQKIPHSLEVEPLGL